MSSIASKSIVKNGGKIYVSSGGTVFGATVSSGGTVYLTGNAKLTGATTMNGTLNVAGTGNSVATLSAAAGSIDFALNGVNVNGTTYMLSTSTAQTLTGCGSISLSASQAKGVYELASGFTLASGTSFELVVGGTSHGSLSVGSSVTIGSASYSLSKSGTKLNLSVAEISLFKGTSGSEDLTGSGNNDIFYGGAGNDTITGSGGHDVAVYDTKNWGEDTISATPGTMSILFKGLSESDVTIRHLGGTTLIMRKSDGSQNIAIEGWNDATHNIVFGGTLSAFDTYLNAASPTQAQQDAARNEVWSKTGLLAG
jgi:autotransporter passenger strand-loop-strand repeat protein